MSNDNRPYEAIKNPTSPKGWVSKHFPWNWVVSYALNDRSIQEGWEDKWLEIKERYKRICVQLIIVESIGEVLPRYFAMEEDNKDIDTLYVKLPFDSMGRIVNPILLKYIGIVGQDETLFWLYILSKHHREIDLAELDKYTYREKLPCFFTRAGSIEARFTETQKEYAKKYLDKMGLKGKYICVAARNSQYQKNTAPMYNEDKNCYRNVAFDDYSPMLGEMGKLNIKTVRMGRHEAPLQDSVKNCIDYAGLYGDDLMDLYLIAGCEFLVVASTGIHCLAMLFSRPILHTNAVPLTFGYGGFRYSEYDIFIPKKHFNAKTGKYMSFMEILEFEKKCTLSNIDYVNAGIELHDNSPEEILDATHEIMDRINGEWVDTPEDKERYEKYLEIYQKILGYQLNNDMNWTGHSVPFRPATTFLRNNSYLLE